MSLQKKAIAQSYTVLTGKNIFIYLFNIYLLSKVLHLSFSPIDPPSPPTAVPTPKGLPPSPQLC